MKTYDLQVETDSERATARLHLRHGDGRHVATNAVRLEDHSAYLWRGLFDTRDHVETWRGTQQKGERVVGPEEFLDEIGLFLGRDVLGEEITATLSIGIDRRLLRVFLPPITESDPLATAFARVPWEIARLESGATPLLAGHVVVRTVPHGVELGPERVVRLRNEEPLRVLLVFAEKPGSRPLAMRRERRDLLDLFHSSVMPHTGEHGERRVEVEVLCHGVSRETLHRALGKPCHVLHWSGHGHHDLLELYSTGDEPDRITGQELVEMIRNSGGYVPDLVFLSACLSGVTLPEGLRQLRDERTGAERQQAQATEVRCGDVEIRGEVAETEIAEHPERFAAVTGFTGTAASLLAAGVPQVVAMRYAVGDDYARDLANRFYRGLLAASQPEAAEGALIRARRELLNAADKGHTPVDHATPVLFGGSPGRFAPPEGRSPDLDRRLPQPQPLLPASRELDPRSDFVGRGEPLTRLHLHWLQRGGPAAATVYGLAGLGKTALSAEVIHLWHRRFKWVFAFQAKPNALQLEEFLGRLDRQLVQVSDSYGQRCEQQATASFHRPPKENFTGSERYQALAHALLEALRAEPILLILDNFETNLEKVPDVDGDRCADPEWDALLASLAERLPETASRLLLLTSRSRLAALMDPEQTLHVPLGPLSQPETVLYLRGQPNLRALAYSDDKEHRKLAWRVLEVSRGHPLILDRLAAFAAEPARLEQALDTLSVEGGLSNLPEVFADRLSGEERECELAYLEDVAQRSVDLLLEQLSPDARRLLWMVSLSFEAVPEPLLRGVWSGRSPEDEKKAKVRALLERLDELPAELRARLEAMPEEFRRALMEEPVTVTEAPPVEPILDKLVAAGLVQRAGDDPPFFHLHELVRERITAWMEREPEERGGRGDTDIWSTYSEHHVATHENLRAQPDPEAQAEAAEAGRRALTYCVQAGALDRLSSFASDLVIGTADPSFLRPIIASLETVAEQVPPGEMRWSVRTYLADALNNASRTDDALPLYEQAAAEAEAAGHLAHLASILHNYGAALTLAGRLGEARNAYLRSAEAERARGANRVDVLGSKLEALRTTVMEGRSETALPEIETRLTEIRGWWQRHRRGEKVAEAPDERSVGGLLISALDIARQASLSLERREMVLEYVDEIETIEGALGRSEHVLARTQFNRYGSLIKLGRLDEAEETLESCLAVFRQVEDAMGEMKVLSGLAEVVAARNDPSRAVNIARRALAIADSLPYPASRGINHNNLANCLVRAEAHEEAIAHRLVSLVYGRLASSGHLEIWLSNLALHLRRARSAGHELSLPCLTELLARPQFAALGRFLEERGITPEALQEELEPIIEGVVQAATGDEG